MANVANKEEPLGKRISAHRKRLGLTQDALAEKLGVSDGNFSRKLRRELPAEDREKVLNIIRELSQEKQEGE